MRVDNISKIIVSTDSIEISTNRGEIIITPYYKDSFNHDAIVTHVLAPLGPDGDLQYKPANYDYQAGTSVENIVAMIDAVREFNGAG